MLALLIAGLGIASPPAASGSLPLARSAATSSGVDGVSAALVASSVGPPASAPTEAYPPLGLVEASGLTSSALHPGVVWVVEDSGEPIVRAFDPTGAQVGSVLFEASDVFAGDNRDTESLAMGPGPALWSADIGDNDAVRKTVLVHTTPEPAQLADTTVTATSYRFTYPDGPRDAEAFLVDPVGGRAYIATKALLGGAGWYAAPTTLTPGATHELTRVQDLPDLLSDGAFSPDGTFVALRTVNVLGGASTATLYAVVRGDSSTPVTLDEIGQVELPAQAQGESLTFTADGATLLVGSEGVDEPIWSVPLAADLLSSATRAAVTTSVRPSGSPGPVAASDLTATSAAGAACSLSTIGPCATSATGALVALLVVLAALLAAILALRRHR